MSSYVHGTDNFDTYFLSLSRSGLREAMAVETASVHSVPVNYGTCRVLSPAMWTEDNDGNTAVEPMLWPNEATLVELVYKTAMSSWVATDEGMGYCARPRHNTFGETGGKMGIINCNLDGRPTGPIF